MNMVTMLKAISSDVRIRLISLLLEHELCVCELEEILRIRQVNISKNLIKLKEFRLVDVRREGLRAFYFLSDEFLKEKELIAYIIKKRESDKILLDDMKRFHHHQEHKDDNTYKCKILY